MIVVEEIIINGEKFVKTYSDADFMIERDGLQYSEAIDPQGLERSYIETSISITENEAAMGEV